MNDTALNLIDHLDTDLEAVQEAVQSVMDTTITDDSAEVLRKLNDAIQSAMQLAYQLQRIAGEIND